MTNRHAETIRRAAILVATLDQETADELLSKMDLDQAALVREAVMELDEISRDERDDVIAQFLNSQKVASQPEDDAVELDPALARKLQSPSGYDDSPRVSQPARVPFHFLRDARTDPLVRHLERQHPQLIAVVVAHLPPERAAEVVKRLTPKTQADVLRRVAELDPTDPDIVRDVEEELEQLLSVELRALRNRSSGLPVVAAILNAAGTQRETMFGNLASHQREFANVLEESLVTVTRDGHQIISGHIPAPATSTSSTSKAETSMLAAAPKSRAKSNANHSASSPERTLVGGRDDVRVAKPAQEPSPNRLARAAGIIQFDALELLSDDAWAALIRAAEKELVLLALAGASETLVNRILSRMPIRDAAALRHRLEHGGPVRLADIDRAQACLGELAGRLAAQGLIQLPESRILATA